MAKKFRLKYVRRWILLLSSLLIFGIIKYFPLRAHGNLLDKRVLFISAYTQSFVTVPEQIKGIQNIFRDQAIELDIEYMDTKRFDTEDKRLQFYDSLKYNLDHVPPYDAIIVGDDNALDFAVKYQEELFPNIPIVFLGINDIQWAIEVAKDPFITGITEETSIKENIEIAYSFNKNATKVIGIVDHTLTGNGDRVQFLLAEEAFPQLEFQVINFSDYKFNEFGSVIAGIESDSILFFLTMGEDKDGTYFSIDKAVDLLRSHAKVPVYRLSIGGVGDGLLGGKMVSYEKSGEVAAQMVMDIFNGIPVKSIEVITESPNQYFFDYKLLQKYNIDMSLIPEGAILVNSPPNLFQEYREYIIYIGIFFIFIILIILFLSFDTIRSRKMSLALKRSNAELSTTTEKLVESQDELQAQYDTIQEQVDNFKALNEKYELTIQSTETIFWEVNAKNRSINFSGNVEGLLHATNLKDKDIYEVMDDLLTSDEKQKILNEYHKYKDGELMIIDVQVALKSDKPEEKWLMIRGKGSFDPDRKTNLLHGIIMDITKTKAQEKYIDFLAHHDYLTKIPNRRSFMIQLEKAIQTGKTGTVVMIDIDNFKSINDSLGHMHGDITLVEIAKKLQAVQDDKLFISRYGGDEFLLLLKEVTDKEEIETYITKIKDSFAQPFYVEGGAYYINFSMGITRFPSDGKDSNHLITNADTAMYAIKHEGKNDYKFYHEDMKEKIKKKTEIEHILRNALNEDGFELFFQPKVDIITGDTSGFEALLRLKEHKISPGEFIPIAEERGLINKIGRWVTLNAIKQVSLWKNKGLVGKPISINFSSEQIKDTEYIDFLLQCLEKYQVEPKDLEIEITESIFLEETETTLLYLNRLKEIGLTISLDDFGTGYSSLNYLTYMPVDMVKIDKSLTDKFLDIDSKNLIDYLISLTHHLDLKITAEGIEKVDQYLKLKESKCDYIQGYLFSKPLAANEIEAIYYVNLVDKVLADSEHSPVK